LAAPVPASRAPPRTRPHDCPLCTDAPLDAPAYAELLAWYLGDGYISHGRRGVLNLHVYNDETYVDLNAHIGDLMRRVTPRGRPHTRRIAGCIVTTVSWKHWPCLFPQHGPGRKHERSIVLEPWQRQIVEAHPGDFLRGLFHSDGSRTANWARRTVQGAPTPRLPALGVREPLRRHPRAVHLGPRPLRDPVAPTTHRVRRGLAA
jgi:hypothetical protein